MSPGEVSLRHYVETLGRELEKRLEVQRKSDRKQFLTILKHQAKALKLQAAEYERRLDILNHAHEEAKSVLHTYALIKDFNELKGRVDVEFADRGGRQRVVIVMFTILSGISIVISVVLAILTYVAK